MPLYEYQCPRGHRTEALAPMRESGAPRPCALCGEQAGRILSPVRVFGDYPGYVSPASGRWIEGRRARTEDFARTGTRPYEAGEKEMAQLRRAQEEQKFETHVDEVVERTAAELGV